MNDTLLTLLAIDKLTEKNENKHEREESLLFPTICLTLIGFGLMYFILNKLGVPSEQLQYTVFALLLPFLWDYILLTDLSNFQHIFTAGGTMIAVFIAIYLLEAIKNAIGFCAKSKYTSVQSFGYVIYMATTFLRGLLFVVFIANLIKFGVHTTFELIFWIF